MVKYLFAALLLFSTAANAIEVTKPDGGVVGYVPHYDVTIAVVAIRVSTIGEGLAVIERKPNGQWELCGQCMPSPQNLAAEVAFHGSPTAYINNERDGINRLLAMRYPAITPTGPSPTAGVQEQLNAVLASGFKLEGAALVAK